jgi:hypothetical protein
MANNRMRVLGKGDPGGSRLFFQHGAQIFHTPDPTQCDPPTYANDCFSSRTSLYRLAAEFGLNKSKVAKGTYVAKCCRVGSSGLLWPNYVHYFE